jgi:hypothetical protein
MQIVFQKRRATSVPLGRNGPVGPPRVTRARFFGKSYQVSEDAEQQNKTNLTKSLLSIINELENHEITSWP